MSYILDALKKAAEQRGANATVLLRPSAPLARVVRFRRLPWIVAGGLLAMNLAALVYLMWPAKEPPAAPQVPAPGTVALIQPIEPPPPAPTQVIPAEPPKPLAPVRPATPPRAGGSRAAATAPSVAATAPVPGVPAPAATPRAAAATAPGPRAAAAPAVPGASAGAGVTPPGDRPLVRATPDGRVSIARPAPADPKPAPAAGAAPAKADARFKLEVLSYSEIPAQRLVFINGRRYREGEVMDSGVKVEEIREDSVILSEAGQRFTLR